uniref:Uncharacterized protein n=1 Tax=Ditylum brightwellii TaxID=49249 RepID=A0A7S1ZXD3_9STRA
MNRRMSSALSGSGMFEASFGGLDLSEFDTGKKSKEPCASAQLMRIKAQEAQRSQMEAKQEAIMRENAALKAREEEERLQRKKDEEAMIERGTTLLLPPPTPPQNMCIREEDPFFSSLDSRGSSSGSDGKEFMSKGGIYTALVQMHGSDVGGGAKKREGGLSSSNSFQRHTKPQRRNALIKKAVGSNRRHKSLDNRGRRSLSMQGGNSKKTAVKKGKRSKY